MSGVPWGDGVRAVGGPGPTAVELRDLDAAAAALGAAARALRACAADLRAAARVVDRLDAVLVPAPVAYPFDAARAEALARAAWAAAARADDLVRRLRRVVELYVEAESWVARTVREVVALQAHVVGEVPLVWPLVAPLAPVVVAAAAAGDPRALAGRQVPSSLVGPVAGFLRGALPGTRVPSGRPLGPLAQELVGGDPAPTALVPRSDPPGLPAPRSAADVLRNVSASYPAAHGGAPGTPPSTISVQRLTHPDGSHGWVVEIPGTQSAGFGGDVATDMTTNARLVAGLPDDMSSGVLHALRDAGVPPDEPVLLAGHSQGGMVAVAAAALAVGSYDVRAVLTAGSPDVPRAVPAGVQVRHYRIDEDLVPQTDGRPDAVSRDVVSVRRSIGSANLAHAHGLDQYVRTAELADAQLAGSPALRGFDAALAGVLGPAGTTAETRQFAVTRAPDAVVTDPATGRRRVPRLDPAPGVSPGGSPG
ncbi:hypothetical protein [Cellulomonas sp. PhB150]|uniref:hypothetical protein n=1 Tax=Cellulomonas sp. PhB150 TaxID=2485188 RepID=UPI000F46B802|nr:hypothetical protein [Cellulomonas sp. PhB150]ROS23871.1 hypothetical protein EDF34_2933 [Cellulomonas sp. PhB150]